MVNTLRVMLWDEEIGRLAWDNRRRLSYFTSLLSRLEIIGPEKAWI